MNLKSERLKKLEAELGDLEQWLRLGLVPKKDLEKHREEMGSLRERIDEERERLRYLKENGEGEEYAIPRRSQVKPAYQDAHSLPEMEGGEEGLTDAGLDMETESFESESHTGEEGGTEEYEEEPLSYEEEEEDPFSDRNRWKRGILEDPDADNW